MDNCQVTEHMAAQYSCADDLNEENLEKDSSSRYAANVKTTNNALLDAELLGSTEEQSGGVGCCHPASRIHRSVALVFMCLLAFGSYYCYDNPSALNKQILHDMNITLAAYDNLYSFYSYPNVILCFFGGFLLDAVFGIRMGTLLFGSITFVGQLIVALGAFFNIFPLMVFGRFVFGIGAESLAVAQNTYAVLWFKGKELNTVFGIQLSVSRLGSMANFDTIPYIYEYIQKQFSGYHGLGVTLLLAASLCLFSVLCALILAFFDKRAERLLRRDENGPSEKINIKDVLYFPLQFWILCIICVFYYVAIFPFFSVASVLLTEKYNLTSKEAAFITGIPYMVSAIVSPFCGMLCDLTGLNLVWTIAATVVSTGCHVAFSMSTTVVPPAAIMGVLGFSLSLLSCAFWPMVAILIPEHQLGTAYGAMQALQNLGVALVNQAAGPIKMKFGSNGLELFFLMWMSLSVVAALLLQIQNVTSKGILNPPQYRAIKCCGSANNSANDQQLLIDED